MRLADDSHDTHSFFVATNNEDLVCQYRVDADEIEVTQCSGNWTMVLEGRVEICIDNQYGTVCDDRWDELEATVVCRQLQHTSTGIRNYYIVWSLYVIMIDVIPVRKLELKYGVGNASIYLDDLDCSGSEANLLRCASDSHGRAQHDCTHEENAGIKCGGKTYFLWRCMYLITL